MSPLALLSAVAIAPADRAKIAAVRARLAEITAVATIHQPPRLCAGQPTAPYNHAHLEVDRLSSALAENPTAENAMLLSEAVAFEQVTPTAGPTILACLAYGAAAASKELATITAAIIDAALAALDSQAASHRPAVEAAAAGPMASGREVSDFDGRIAALRQQLETHRGQAVADPLGWITGNGIGEPEVPETPAKPTPAPVKNFRGKVAMPAKEPEPTAPDDVLSGLADEDEIDLEDPLSLISGT